MTTRPVRVTLLLLFLAAMGASAYLFWIAEQQGQAATAAARTFEASARAAQTEIADLRSAQEAYVAAGQGEDFWFTKVGAMLTDLKTRVDGLRAQAAAGQTRFDDVAAALQDFEQMDRRVRDHLKNKEVALASNQVFADGFDLARRLDDGIEQARVADLAARDAAASALHQRQLFSLGAAAAAATLIVLLLVPAASSRPVEPAISVAPAPAPKPARKVEDLPLTPVAPAAEAEGWSRATRMTPPAPVAPAPTPATAIELPPIDLSAVCSLCNDLARIVDTTRLPALLDRAATVLDASGIILWVADPDGRELAPIMTHGYPSGLVSRLGTIPRDAANATASAFRTSLLQTVKADSSSNGAIAAPLLTSDGCVGVMAAEVRRSREQQDVVLAAAGIIAAQLATLIGPPAVRSSKAEAAG